jgi:hypothetical protein
MTTFASPEPREESGDPVEMAVTRLASRREAVEALGLLLGLLFVLTGLALTVGSSTSIGP